MPPSLSFDFLFTFFHQIKLITLFFPSLSPFQGLASGTLLYVTFFEIFAAEGRKLHNKFIHILVAMIGFVMMASLEYLGKFGIGLDLNYASWIVNSQ